MLCWGPEEDWAGIRGGACLGMLHNIHLRGRYLLKFQLLREMAEESEALPLPCEEVQFFYLKLVFLTCPKVKKQRNQATSASLQGKPGKAKWGLLLDSPTSAAVTAGFKNKKHEKILEHRKDKP